MVSAQLAAEQLFSDKPVSLVPLYIPLHKIATLATLNPESIIRTSIIRLMDKLDLSPDDELAQKLQNSKIPFLLLIDGLNEAVITPEQLQGLLSEISEVASPERSFVLFSRPNLLEELTGASFPILELVPFSSTQIEKWLELWHHSHPEQSQITLSNLSPGGTVFASNPLLLLMMAVGHKNLPDSEKLTRSQIFEAFFKRVLGITDLPLKKLLQLLSRLAWEVHRMEFIEPEQGNAYLDTFITEQILGQELKILSLDDSQVLSYANMGSFIFFDFSPDDSHEFYFGHRTFFEFLVSLYWETHLYEIISAPQASDDHEKFFYGSDLLRNRDDQAFLFLIERFLCWPEEDQQKLTDWARQRVTNTRLYFSGNTFDLAVEERTRLRRTLLAIACTLSKVPFEATTEQIRTLLGFYTTVCERSHLHVPGLHAPGIHLGYCELFKGDFRNADLSGANLAGTDFSEAQLSGANLSGANLTGARLEYADLEGANLASANLSKSNLSGANLKGVNLRSANLEYATLRGACLEDSDLRNACLKNGDFRQANLAYSVFSQANFERANLTDSILKEC